MISVIGPFHATRSGDRVTLTAPGDYIMSMPIATYNIMRGQLGLPDLGN